MRFSGKDFGGIPKCVLAVVLPLRTFWAKSQRRPQSAITVIVCLLALLLAKVGYTGKNEVCFVQRKGGDQCLSANLKIFKFLFF